MEPAFEDVGIILVAGEGEGEEGLFGGGYIIPELEF